MEKETMRDKLSKAMEKVRSLDDTEEIPFLDKDLKPTRKRKRRKTRKETPFSAVLGILCASLVTLSILGWYVYDNYFGQSISLLDASVLTYTGYNGKGAAAEGFAPEAAALAEIEKRGEKLESQGKDATSVKLFADSIVCGFNRSEGLRNGDTITYACSYSSDYAKAAHYRVKDTQASYKVSGLADLRVLNPFEGVTASWNLENTGTSVRFSIPDLQNSLGITYRWSYGTEDNTYNGHSIFAEADYSSVSLASSGYVIENDKAEIEMGNMPSIISSITQLTPADQQSLIDQMRTVMEAELNACGHVYTLNSETLEVTGASSGYLSQNSATAWYEPDTAFTITFDLQIGNKHHNNSIWNRLQSYTISYTGTIYRLSDGTVQFNNQSAHGCYFAGYVGIYHVADESESSEIFGGWQETFNNVQHQAEDITQQAQQFTEDIGNLFQNDED